jgi:hypothetical protein
MLMTSYMALASPCSISDAELREQRLENIRLEAAIVAQDNITFFKEQASQIFNESTITYRLEATGVFPPEDAVDYVSLLVPNPVISLNPESRQFPQRDFTRVEEVAPNIYKIPGSQLTFNVYDPVAQDYVFKIDGVRTLHFFRFDDCSPRINAVTTKVDRTFNEFQVEVISSVVPIEVICPIGFGVCLQAGLLADTGYSSIEECIDQYNSIAPDSPCPSRFSSDTVICRAIHTFSTLLNATVHCKHLPFDSPVCFDRCLPDCANCDANAHCVEQFNETAVVANDLDGYLDYFCECDDGYVGDGESCTLKTCQADWECAVPGEAESGVPFHICDMGVCKCRDTLKWLPQTGACGCRSDQFLTWEGGLPVCLDEGKCLHRWQCQQDYNDVKCKQFDFPNTLSLGDFCLCHSSFDNVGFTNPQCFCQNGTKTWSNIEQGNVCIREGQCVAGWQCQSGQICQLDGINPVGTCV